jgi:hypothetical protein
MILIVGSLALGLANVGAMLGVARWPRNAYLIAIAIQVPWAAYDVITRQYGFLLISAVAVPAYIREIRRLNRSARSLPGIPPSGSP